MQECLHERLVPALADKGIRLVLMTELTQSEWNTVVGFFEA